MIYFVNDLKQGVSIACVCPEVRSSVYCKLYKSKKKTNCCLVSDLSQGVSVFCVRLEMRTP